MIFKYRVKSKFAYTKRDIHYNNEFFLKQLGQTEGIKLLAVQQ